MSLDCPTCGRSDAHYDAVKRAEQCSDPWHGDAHLRRKSEAHRMGVPEAALGATSEAKARTATTERAMRDDSQTTIRMRAEMARRWFEGALQRFVNLYAPVDPFERDNFQRDLMMLFRDAMEHKSMVYGMHIDRTETVLGQLSMAATGSVQAIFETEAQRQTREMRQRAFEIANQPKKET